VSEIGHAGGRLRRSLVMLLAVSTGLAVANNYYAQPLLPEIGKDLHMSPGVAGYIVTVAQAGYAVGLLLLLPLGDLVERRRLAVTLCVLTGLGLVVLGASPSSAVLLPAAFLVGSFSVLAQVLVALTASLASSAERGRVVGMVMSGLLIGILLARTVSGLIAETGSWRTVYFAAAAVMGAEGLALRLRLPTYREGTEMRYPELVGSVATLLKQEPVLRLRSLFGMLSFGSFSALWTSIAFLLTRHYHYSSAVIGLFGLVGAAGATAAVVAGRHSDKDRALAATGVTTTLLVLSWFALWAGGTSVALLIVGILVLDVGAQGLHITNQGEIYKRRPEARSRITAAYMVSYFIGGAAGSALSASFYSRDGWHGACAVGEAFAVAALAAWLVSMARGLRRNAGARPPSRGAARPQAAR
jgi:predicted MFS family arabinose efflux permease